MFNKIIGLRELDNKSSSRSVYAREKSISQSEFFQAAQSDIQAATCFIIRSCDYNGEEFIEYNSKTYHIYRIFNVKNEMVELWCEVRIGDQK
ncbi:MAG: phage head closure protein [Enterococcus sp.]|nr:phage head closure protein [Enterococcus sp.]